MTAQLCIDVKLVGPLSAVCPSALSPGQTLLGDSIYSAQKAQMLSGSIDGQGYSVTR